MIVLVSLCDIKLYLVLAPLLKSMRASNHKTLLINVPLFQRFLLKNFVYNFRLQPGQPGLGNCRHHDH